MSAAGQPTSSIDIIRIILDEEDFMRWQDPTLEKRTDVSRPFWFIRPVVPVVTAEGMRRKQRPIRLGFCDEMSEKKAKQEKQRVMATINQGKFLLQCQIYFRDVLKKYKGGRLPQLGAATREKYRHHIENHIEPAFGELRMSDIDPPMIQCWLNDLAQPKPDPRKPGHTKPGLAWWTRSDLRNIMSAIFKQAAKWHLWDGVNPAADVSVGTQEDAREKRLPKAQDFVRLLNALPENVRFMLEIASFCGLRISEVLGLKWSDIDFDAGTLRVDRRWHRGDLGPVKTRASKRTRQLAELASEFRRRYPGDAMRDTFIFAEDGTVETLPDDRNLNQHVLRKTAKRLGIYWKGCGFHVFRRLYISWRQECGGTPLEAMRGAGHTKVDMTMLYTVTDAEREREQVNRMLKRVM